MAKFAVLASGMALGHYIPAVLVQRELAGHGHDARLFVYERYLSKVQQCTILRTRDHYQRRPELMHVGQRLHGVLNREKAPSRSAIAALQDFGPKEIVIFSGQWSAIVRESSTDGLVHLVHIDLTHSPSWQAASNDVAALLERGAATYWVSRTDNTGRYLAIVGSIEAPVPWVKRHPTTLAHGGGWGLTDLVALAEQLENASLDIDMLIGSQSPDLAHTHRLRQFSIPREWTPWAANVATPFPPLMSSLCSQPARSVSNGNHHHSLALARKSLAIISKPGGMSLAESLLCATPVIFLDACGIHESENCKAWIKAGFGLSFETWVAAGFDRELLHRAHCKLLDGNRKARFLIRELGAQRKGVDMTEPLR